MDSQWNSAGRLSRPLPSAVWAVAVILLTIVLALCTAPVAPAAEPNRNLDSYVLFGYEGINFPAAGPSHKVVVQGGNVGVNLPARSSSRPSIRMESAFIMPDIGSQLVGDVVRVPESSDVYDLFSNSLLPATLDPLGIVRNSGPSAVSLPLIDPAALPTVPAISPGSTNVRVGRSESLDLSPGSYDRVKIRTHGVLNLGNGLYEVSDFEAGNGSTVNVTPSTVLRATGRIRFKKQSKVLGSAQAHFLAGFDGSRRRFAFALGRNVEFHGQALAPAGTMHLGTGNILFGRFWAEFLHCDCNLTITYVPPGCQPEDASCNPPVCNPAVEQCAPPPCDPATNPACATSTPGCTAPCDGTTPSSNSNTASAKRVKSGRARLSAPSGCLSRRSRIRIRGRSIRKVTFYLDGKRVKIDRKAPYAYRPKLRLLRVGHHRLKARVRFRRGAHTKRKILKRALFRCARSKPRFTG